MKLLLNHAVRVTGIRYFNCLHKYHTGYGAAVVTEQKLIIRPVLYVEAPLDIVGGVMLSKTSLRVLDWTKLALGTGVCLFSFFYNFCFWLSVLD